MRDCLLRTLLISCFLGSIGGAGAHVVDRLTFWFSSEELVLEGQIDVSYMMPETRSVEDAPLIQRLDLMNAGKERQQDVVETTESILRRCIRVTADDRELPLSFGFPEFDTDPLVLPDNGDGAAYITVKISLLGDVDPSGLWIKWDDDAGASLLIAQMIEGLWQYREIGDGESMALLGQGTSEAKHENEEAEPKRRLPVLGLAAIALMLLAAGKTVGRYSAQ